MRNGIKYIFGVLLMLVSGLAGWTLHSEYAVPDITINQDSVVVIDKGITAPPTYIEGPKIVVNLPAHEVIAKIDSTDEENKVYSYRDSLIIVNDSTDVRVMATVKTEEKNLEFANFKWDYSIKPIIKTITKQTEKRIYKTIEVEKPQPFYSNHWFWTTIAAVAIAIASLIGS